RVVKMLCRFERFPEYDGVRLEIVGDRAPVVRRNGEGDSVPVERAARNLELEVGFGDRDLSTIARDHLGVCHRAAYGEQALKCLNAGGSSARDRRFAGSARAVVLARVGGGGANRRGGSRR